MSDTPQPIVEKADHETRLQISETRFRNIVEGSLHGIVIQQQGRIVYANPAMANLFGYASPGAMIGLSPFDDLVAEKERPLLRSRTSAVYQGDQVEPHPGWLGRRPDGQAIWVSSTAQISEWQGRPAITSFYVDITDEKRSQARHYASEAKLQLGIAIAGIGLGAMDYLANTITLDATAAALFALPADRPIPRADVHARFHLMTPLVFWPRWRKRSIRMGWAT